MEEPQFNSRVPQPYNAPYPSQPYAPPGSIPNGPYMDSNYQAQEPKLCSLREVLEYFMTPIGIVKIVSVIFGFTALTLTAYGYSEAKLFQDTHNRTLCDYSEGLPKDCMANKYYRDELCQRYNEVSKYRYRVEWIKACPSRWLVMPQTYMIGFVWAGTFFVLLALVLLQLNKNRIFRLIDLIGHLFAAPIIIVSGLCLIGYYGSVQLEDMCSETNLRAEIHNEISHQRRLSSILDGDHSRYPYSNLSNPGTRAHSPNPNTSSSTSLRQYYYDIDHIFNVTLARCPEIQDKMYLPNYFLSAGIIALITGIMYSVIAALPKSKSSQSITASLGQQQQPGPMAQWSQGPSQMFSGQSLQSSSQEPFSSY